ncbi:amino acid-binding protein [Saccharomonospora azurea SZMC 14600]|uniref:ABC transporter substrate-binding protein n=1 Tax=Saccharomonospora azurea TaxID=40988 RepID=UPI00023FF373|nr:ABC transporter substrate-binding protein [Saccharomonospora azurea]EHK88325.1 amino acid-binding protein [Saccharomonospora azurea SZMC 14600]
MRASAWRSAIVASAAALVLAACGGGEVPRGDDGGDGVLNLGYVLPETGPLAAFGPAQIESVRLAVEDINDAGGVLTQPIPEVVGADEGGTARSAAQAADRVLSLGVDAVIGASASEASLSVVDSVTGAGVLQCSGSNTASALRDHPDSGLYFRTAPDDTLQAKVLSKLVTEDDNERVGIVARGDDYGTGLLDATSKELKAAGAGVVLGETYEPGTKDFDRLARQLRDADVDAVVLASFDEGAALLRAMIGAGVGPQQVDVYGADGLRRAELASEVSPDDPGVLAGMKGTAPAVADDEYAERLRKFAPDLVDLQYGAQVFDCVTVVALAAQAAQTDDPIVFAAEVGRVTTGGEKCGSFAECKRLLDQGTDIDYDGVSGPLDFVERGEPGKATYAVYGFDPSGALRTERTEQASTSN